MITKDLLKKVMLEQRSVFFSTEKSIEREIIQEPYFQKCISAKEAVVITGVRRCGKSYLMRLIWQDIRKKHKISEERCFFLNFEDERFLHFTARDFDTAIICYEELFEITASFKHNVYLFFDEIQVVKGWEKFIHRLLETGRYKIFITGSNASLLSKEIGTALTGRSVSTTLYPLSFREYVSYKIGKIPSDIEQRGSHASRLQKLYHEYSFNGGFPEVVIQQFRPLLQEYVRTIVSRDIVSRYHIRHEVSLRELVAFLVSNSGVVSSLARISQMVRIKNLSTIKNYLGHLENSYLFVRLSQWSTSVKKQIYNPDKFYPVDHGMYQEIGFALSPNEGRILENIVAIELLRRRNFLYYGFDDGECDFIVKSQDKSCTAVQVTKYLGQDNIVRESAWFSSPSANIAKKKYIIVEEYDDVLVPILKKQSIEVWDIVRWLLG
ncbi:MAG: ATP-binding protein [bacterium]|nr:ATP-binding protein [bacterium]